MVWQREHRESVDSTNAEVARRARDGAREGLVISAEFQRAGRGRLDRTWSAAPGSSLLVSILLRPPVGPDEVQWIVASVALSARSALVKLAGSVELKWPNDLLVGRKKIAGILAELVTTDEGPAIVVGLGINLLGSDHVENATTVSEAFGVTLNPLDVLDVVLDELRPRREKLATSAGRAEIREEYRQTLATLHQRVRCDFATSSLVGVAVGVDDRGRLLVDTGDELVTVSAADVVHLRREESK